MKDVNSNKDEIHNIIDNKKDALKELEKN